MSNSPDTMPIWVKDYLADTAHMSTEQHGACLLLMMHLHHNGTLPSDDRGLSRVARTSIGKWRRMSATVMEMVNALPKKGVRQ